MRLVVVNGIEADGVARAVDARTYARGLLFAQRRAVRATEWDDECTALYADVGDGDVVYEAAAYFQPRRALLEFMVGTCTCPVATNCAHVVASVLTAVGSSGRRCRHGGSTRPGSARSARCSRRTRRRSTTCASRCRSPSSCPCPPVARGR